MTPQEQAQDQLNQQLLSTYEAWGRHPVTVKIINTLRDKCNETIGKLMGCSVTSSIPDNQVRQLAIQLSAYNDAVAIMTQLNTFMKLLPVVKTDA